ncbi:MAG TPA: hypothetical protein GXX28_04775 [Firmicutes bacterium]|nr:hypothetical protein [Bacillota bacterium]
MVKSLINAGLSASGTLESELQAEVNDVNNNIAPYLEEVAKAFMAPYGIELTQIAPGQYDQTDIDNKLRSGMDPWGSHYGTWTINCPNSVTQVITITESGGAETWTFKITGPGGFEESGTSNMLKQPIPGQLNSNSFSFTIRTNRDATPVSFTGSISANLDAQGSVTSGKLQGAFSSAKFNGSGTLDFTTFPSAPSVPQKISYTGTVQTVSRTYTGNFTMEAVPAANPSVTPALPSHLAFDGSYNCSTSGVSVQGKLDAQFTNADTYDPASGETAENFVQGTFAFNGSFVKPAQPTVAVDVKVTRNVYDQYSADLSYSWGTAELKGTIVHDVSDANRTVVVHLTNEAGLTTDITIDRRGQATGAITGFGTKVADIVHEGINIVRYADGGFDSLF